MRKALFAILACCLVASSAFSQTVIPFKLSEDQTSDEKPFYDGSDELGRFAVFTLDEPDGDWRTTVKLQLENNSSDYKFLLFDSNWSKKKLRKNNILINFADNSKKVENIELVAPGEINKVQNGQTYTFPSIPIDEGETFECIIPIHLTQPKPCLFNRKREKIHRIEYCTISISMGYRDKTYENLEDECLSLCNDLRAALARHDFCTHKKHKQSFDKQTEKYTTPMKELRAQINDRLAQKNWSESSKRYQSYTALLDSLDLMNRKLEQYKIVGHDCGEHVKIPHHCKYCNLTLEQIYSKLEDYYLLLWNGKTQKADIIKDVNTLYNCCTDPTCPTHSQAWKDNDPFKSGIEDFYREIKNFQR